MSSNQKKSPSDLHDRNPDLSANIQEFPKEKLQSSQNNEQNNQVNANEKHKADQNRKKKGKSSHSSKSSKQPQEIIDDPIIQEKKKQAALVGDIDDDNYNKLSQLFTNDPFTAISECENYLKSPTFSEYDAYIEKVRKQQKTNCCLTSWNRPSLVGFCLDCQVDPSCCVCIPCYLAGKHYEHHSYIKLIDGGSCDCGNPNNWKNSGNCYRHNEVDLYPDLSQMDVEDRKKFITVFKSAFFGAFSSHNDLNCSAIFQWIKKILQYGDGIRRCCSIAIASISSKFFFTELLNLENESISNFINLLYDLISDKHFMIRMGSTIILNYTNFIKKMQKFILERNYDKMCKPYFTIKNFCFFSYNFFNDYSFTYLLNEKKFNWVDFVISSIKIIMDTVLQMQCETINNSGKDIVRQISYLKKFIVHLIKIDEQHENLQNFIDNYSNLLINYESKFFYVFSVSEEKNNTKKGMVFNQLLIQLYGINSLFCIDSNSSEKNKKFVIDKTFSSLATFIKSEQNLKYNTIYTLKDEVPVVFFLPVHHLFYCLSSSYQNISEIISLNCQKNGIEVEEFCFKTSIYPTRLLISVLASERFEILSEDVKIIINTFLTQPEISFNKFFGLYQILLALSKEKEKMICFLALTFSFFLDSSTIRFKKQLGTFGMFEFFNIIKEQENSLENAPLEASYFIMSVLTDRSIITFDKKLFKRLRIMELLIIEHASIERIEQYGLDRIDNPEFSDDLISYTERVQSKDGKFYYRLKNENDFQPFFPFIVNRSRNNIFNKFTKNLIPLMEYKDLPNGLSLKECFRTPTFIILMRECLLSKNNLAATQVGLSMFIMSMLNGQHYDANSYKIEKPIEIKYIPNLIDELIELRPILKEKNPNFSMIMFTDNESKKHSILDLVRSNNQLGNEAIKKADIPIFRENENDKKEKKKNVNFLKLNILTEFEMKRQFFINNFALNEATIFSDEPQPSKCFICNNDINEISGYPCLSVPTILPSLINKKLHNLNSSLEDLECVFSLVINNHPVHFHCYQQNNNNANNNNGQQNCLLPIFSTESDDIFKTKQSVKMIEAMDDFMIRAFNLFESNDNLIPMKSFAGLVSILEVRHRNRPDCFDRLNVPLLLRNLLLTLYFSYHKDKTEINTKDQLLNLVLSIINSNSPIGEFKVLVKKIASEFNDDNQLFEFLRRSAIIEEFALKVNKDKKYVDWDEIFSFKSLLSRFEIIGHKAKLFELPLFQTIQLPEKFIELYKPPFNLDIFDYSVMKFVDLLTGQVVIIDQENRFKGKLPSIFDYVQKIYHGGLAMFLCLTGSFATQLIVHIPNTRKIVHNGGFYVDRFGGLDSGFKRGSNLHLSHDILENDLDRLLSGNYIILS